MTDLSQIITEAFQAEHAANRPAVTLDELPLSYEAMSAEWLTAVLCAGRDDVRVSHVDLGPADDGSTNRRAVRLSYEPGANAVGLPTRLFCKAAHGLANRLLLGLFGSIHAEVTFYRDVRDAIGVETPACFHANYDPRSLNAMILLEDISERAVEFGSHRTIVNRARAEAQITLLADIHGPFHASPELATRFGALHDWPTYFANACRFNLEAAASRGFLAGDDLIPPRLYRRHDEIWPATLEAVRRHGGRPQTITHNDVHLGNWYMLPGDRVGITDWGCCTRGHWSRDLAYTIATSLAVEDRRAWERDLIRRYLDRMAAHGVREIDFDQAWDLYREQLLSALTWWTVPYSPDADMPDGMQPRDTVRVFLARIATAIDDHDTLDLFTRSSPPR